MHRRTMASYSPWQMPLWAAFFWSLLLLQAPRLSQSSPRCPAEERAALQELKASLVESGGVPPASWDEENAGGCCSWEGVECSNTTGRVKGLHLYAIAYSISDEAALFRAWNLSFHLFRSFPELRHLNLSTNRIGGSLASTDFSGLAQLTVLDLSMNRLRGRIPPSWTTVPSLRTLNLADNFLTGSFPAAVLLRGLQSLQELYLERNQLNGTLPPSLGKHHRIQSIGLSGNLLEGPISPWAFSNLSSLQFIDMSVNHLEGSIPSQAFSNLASLRHIDLSKNKLQGHIAPETFSNLTSLEFLDLSYNSLQGLFPLPSLTNLSKLQEVILSYNSGLDLDASSQQLVPSFQLRLLAMSGCNLGGSLFASPVFLSSQAKLEVVDLSNNNKLGRFPSWFLRNHSRLVHVNLRNSSLAGELHLPLQPITSIKTIDLSVNNIHGVLSHSFGLMFPNLWFLNLSMNHLTGTIPPSLGNMSQLEGMDLSTNHLSGELPPHITSGCISLRYLKLSHNNLHGKIPGILPHITYLSGNEFTGLTPRNLSRSTELALLDCSDNQLSGSLAHWVGGLSSLGGLILSGNNLQGEIPVDFCGLISLQLLDLSNNNFTGAMPHCSTPLPLVYLDLACNKFLGPIPTGFFNTSELVSLNLRNNQFSGSLPSRSIGNFSSLRVLLLHQNNLEGPIPVQLCRLRHLHMLDLSHNHLSGSIPTCFIHTPFNGMVRDDNGDIEGTVFWALPRDAFTSPPHSSSYSSDAANRIGDFIVDLTFELQEVQFMTKGNSYPYEGSPLSLMIGIDVSANKLTGVIPSEIGRLTRVKVLNFSYNQLTGSIPETLSNLKQIESLDLSHNHLSGQIPWQLTQLKSLEVFSVAHNDLSGCVPEWKDQFATFGVDSYEGNVGLHGPPLDQSCESSPGQGDVLPQGEEEDGDSSSMDDIILYAISAASSVVFFWGTVGVLHLNQTGGRVLDRAAKCVLLCSSALAGWIRVLGK